MKWLPEQPSSGQRAAHVSGNHLAESQSRLCPEENRSKSRSCFFKRSRPPAKSTKNARLYFNEALSTSLETPRFAIQVLALLAALRLPIAPMSA